MKKYCATVIFEFDAESRKNAFDYLRKVIEDIKNFKGRVYIIKDMREKDEKGKNAK